MSLPKRKINMILIEPIEGFVRDVCVALQPHGHEITTSPSAAALLQRQSLPPVALVLIACEEDSAVPREILRQIRQRLPQAAIVAAVPSGQIKSVAMMLGAEIDGYVLRPYVAAELQRKISDVEEAQFRQKVSFTFADLQKSLTTMPDAPHVKRKIVRTLTEEYGYKTAMFHILKPNKVALSVFAASPGTVNHYENNPAYDLHLSHDRSVIGRCFQEKKSIIISDLTAEEHDFHFRELIELEGWRGMIAVPLLIKQDVQGVMVCYTAVPHTFSQLELRVLEEFANLASLDHYNARQYTKWELIEQKSQLLAEVHTLETAINVIAENVLDMAEAGGAAVCFYDADKHQFDPQLSRSVGELGAGLVDWANLSLPWSLTFKKAIKEIRILVADIDDPEEAKQVAPEVAEAMKKAEVKACIIRTLMGNEDPVGVMVVFYAFEHPYANPDEDHEYKRPFTVFANQAAVTLERAKAYRRKQLENAFIQWFTKKTTDTTVRENVKAKIWRQTLGQLMELTGAERAILGFRDRWGIQQHAVPADVPADYVGRQIERGRRSMEGWAIEERTAVMSRNLRTDPTWRSLHTNGLGAITSKMVVPIIGGTTGEAIGLITLEHAMADVFDQDDLQLVNNLATHIGIDVQEDSFSDTSNYFSPFRQIDTFVEMSQQFTSIRPIRDKLSDLLHEMRAELDYDLVSLHIADHQWDQFERPIMAGETIHDFIILPNKLMQKRLKDNIGRTLPIYVSRAPHTKSVLPLTFLEREKVHTSAVIFLYTDEKLAALLTINQRQNHEFAAREKSRLLTYTDEIMRLLRQIDMLPSLLANLRDLLRLDLVSLHVYSSREQKWARPIHSGAMRQPLSWPPMAAASNVITRILKNQDSYNFVPDALQDPMLNGAFVEREGIRAAGYVKVEIEMEAGDKFVVILFVNRRKVERWNKSDNNMVRMFATAAAIAVQNQSQLKKVRARVVKLNALQKAGSEITLAGLDLKTVANIVLTQAIAITEATFGTLRLLRGDSLEAIAVWGVDKAQEPRWYKQWGHLPIDGAGLAAELLRNAKQDESARYNLVPNVREGKSRFINTSTAEVASSLPVILRDIQDGRPIGVLSVDHPEVGGLDENDARMLILLADMASVALKSAERLEHLETTDAIAWRGLFGANWWHTAAQKSLSIKTAVLLLEQHIKGADDQTRGWLRSIRTAAQEIDRIPLKGMLPAVLETTAEPIRLNALLKRAIFAQCKNLPLVRLDFDNLDPADPYVTIHKQLFELALEKLVNNAIQAMENEGTIRVSSQCMDDIVRIHLADTGPGIPPEIQDDFLRSRIEKNGTNDGFGLGALMAKFVFRRYGGDLVLNRSSRRGTVLTITLPVYLEG